MNQSHMPLRAIGSTPNLTYFVDSRGIVFNTYDAHGREGLRRAYDSMEDFARARRYGDWRRWADWQPSAASSTIN